MSRTNEGAGDPSQKVAEIKDAATQRYSELRDQATQYYNDGRQRATEWEQGVERYIQEQPLKAVLMAAGAGLLLGMIWKR